MMEAPLWNVRNGPRIDLLITSAFVLRLAADLQILHRIARPSPLVASWMR
jgi:hypothetical protein